MSDDYIFSATGDSCEVCQALDGMRCTALPHPNCQCSITPLEGYGCETHMEVFGPDEIEPGKYSIGAEISVTCPHGTEMGTTLQYITTGSDDEDPMGFANECSDAADELCAECPDPKEPFNCC